MTDITARLIEWKGSKAPLRPARFRARCKLDPLMHPVPGRKFALPRLDQK
jgi:hypothetical protein